MSTLGTLYQQSMLKHPYGYALYEPESSKVLQPGFCGYLTELGQWTPLVGVDKVPINLGDALSLARNGLTPFDQFRRAPTDKRSWGPKLCGRVTQKKIDLEAGVSLIPAGIPADVGALYRYGSNDGFGAILMTQSPVIKDFVYGRASFHAWCKENSEAILRKWPDVRERGLVIVTSTYTTASAMTNAWSDTGKEVSIGFRASAVEIGEMAPSCAWYISNEEGGWVSAEASEPNEKKVVFFGGLYFKYRRLAPILPHSHTFSAGPIEKKKYRGAASDTNPFRIIDQDDDDDVMYEVMVTSEPCGEMVDSPDDMGDGSDDF